MKTLDLLICICSIRYNPTGLYQFTPCHSGISSDLSTLRTLSDPDTYSLLCEVLYYFYSYLECL